MVQVCRSLLFVPADRPERVAKAAASDADVVIVDLEDAVAASAKASAQRWVAEELGNLASKSRLALRVNAADSPWFSDDLSAAGKAGVDYIMVPKAGAASGISDMQQAAEIAPVLALVETASGVLAAADIADSGVAGLCFGHVDYSLDMGLSGTSSESMAVRHARAQVALAARAHQILAIDSVSVEFRDLQAFSADVQFGQECGFSGKMCIHPAQISPVNEQYSPSEKQIIYAQQVVEAWEESLQQGLGALSLNGKMIDKPVADAQYALLETAKALNLIN